MTDPLKGAIVPPTAPSAKGRRRATVAIAIVIVLGGFALLLSRNLGQNVVFFLTPQELLAKGTNAVDVPLRLGGLVVPGSVKWDADRLDLSFAVTDTGGLGRVRVHSTGAPPQMFHDGMGVVVEGRYHDGVFNATNLMVKHSNEYHPPKPGEKPSEMYKSLIRDAKS